MNDVILTRHVAADIPDLLDGICDTYADAYGDVAGEDSEVKVAAFRDRAASAVTIRNYELVVARSDEKIVGFVFGYGLRPDSDWWQGLDPEQPSGFTTETGDRSVVLAEIEVRRDWQSKGVGRMLHDSFLGGRIEERATLVTKPDAVSTQALYEGWGWTRLGVVPGGANSYYPEYIIFVLSLPAQNLPR